MRGICYIFILCSVSAAAVELKFGPEFTISSDEIFAGQPVNRMQEGLPHLRKEFFKNQKLKESYEKLVTLLKSRLVDGREPGSAFQITSRDVDGEARLVLKSPHGWEAILGLDPGVFEWTLTPMTLRELQRHAQELQQILFDIPNELGLAPMLFGGGGHINIGAGAFLENRQLLLKFVKDYLNHAELSLGILSYDTNNALNYWLVPSQIEMLKRSLSDLSDNPNLSVDDFVRRLQSSLSPETQDEFLLFFRKPTYTYRPTRGNSWALAFKRDQFKRSEGELESWRLEIRAARPQTSFAVFLKQAELFQRRLDYLEAKGNSIDIKSRVTLKADTTLDERLYNPPVDPQMALQSFYEYVVESGLNWEHHQEYIWPMWITMGELTKFNESLSSKCRSLLSVGN